MPHPQTASGPISGANSSAGITGSEQRSDMRPHALNSSRSRFARGAKPSQQSRSDDQPVPLRTPDELGSRPEQVQLRARRSPKLVAIGALLACLGGLGGALLLQSSAHTTSVLVMSHSVARGATVSAADVTSVTMGVAPLVASLPASELSHVVGQVALVDLPAGSLPGPGSVGKLPVALSDTQLGLKLAAGHVPTTRLEPGTAVLLVPVSNSANEAAPAGAPISARVASSPQSVAGDAVVLDVAVPPAQAATVAQWAARGAVSVVRQGQK